MSEMILSDELGNTREAALAALIVGALVHEGLITLSNERSTLSEDLGQAIRLVARLLKDNVREDMPVLPISY